ncbi:MAG TPA: hemolysin family protein [Stenomitos sp.]
MDGSVPLGAVDEVTGVGVLLLCLIGVAFFSSSEAAIISVNKLRIAALAEKGSRSARAVQRLVSQHDRLFGTILLLENALIIIATAIFTVLATRYLKAPDSEWQVAIASLVMTLLIVVFTEITPKTFAAQHPERYAMLVARPMLAVMALSSPAVWLVTSLTNAMVAATNRVLRMGDRPVSLVTRDEIRMLVDVVQAEGDLASDETEMIQSIFELGDTTAREIMVPRIDMVTLSTETTFEAALQLALTEGHSRLPMVGDSLDDIRGILYVKDLLAFLTTDTRPRRIPETFLRPAYFIPESKRVDDLLRDMRRDRLHMAIVMDEYGGTAGLLTIEDLLEEIVGEIRDEYDEEDGMAIEPQPDGSVLVDGAIAIHEVNATLGLQLPDTDFDTLGGFVVGLLGRAPVPGEAVTFQQLYLVAESVKARRLTRVRLYRNGTGPLELAADSEGETS